MKTVYKYATGEQIPEDAKYICTKVETQLISNPNGLGGVIEHTSNILVWHYYEVKINENPSRD